MICYWPVTYNKKVYKEEKTMSNQRLNFLNESENDLRELEKQKREIAAKRKIRCSHTAYTGANLVPIAKAKNIRMSREDRAKYSKNTMVCTRCGEIVDMSIFTPEQIDQSSFLMRSALAQIQIIIGAKLDDSEQEELMTAFMNLDYVSTMLEVIYNDMIENLQKKKGKEGNSSKVSKGGYGVTRSMMN